MIKKILILVGLSIFLISLNVVEAEQFTYNMTKRLNEETRLLDLCINTTIKLPQCETIYGGLNTTYGEKR